MFPNLSTRNTSGRSDGSYFSAAAAPLALLLVFGWAACGTSKTNSDAQKKIPAEPTADAKPHVIGDSRESAVESGLRWLLRHQNDDGSWSPDHYMNQCAGTVKCQGAGYPDHHVGVTGLATLAFLGAGYDGRCTKEYTDPILKKRIIVGPAVEKALRWLKDQQDEAGSFARQNVGKWGYNQAVATLAMCEAYGLTRAPQYKTPAQKGIDCLLSAQNTGAGGELRGWRYQPRTDMSDISVTGWCTLALKSAQMAGLNVSQNAVDGAFQFVREVTEEREGHVGYTKREEAGQQVKAMGKNEDYQNHPSFAAIGMAVRQWTQTNTNDPVLERSAKLLAADLPAWNKAKKSNDYYYWYFGTLALVAYDGNNAKDGPHAGEYWNPWSEAIKRSLLDHQHNNPRDCDDGSWDSDDRWSFEGGRVFVTALNSVTFEMYYRYSNPAGAHSERK